MSQKEKIMLALTVVNLVILVLTCCTPAQQRAARTAAQGVLALAEVVCAADDTVPGCLRKCQLEDERRRTADAGAGP